MSVDPIEAMTVSGTARESTWNPAADAKLAALKGIISAGQAAKAHRCVVSGETNFAPAMPMRNAASITKSKN